MDVVQKMREAEGFTPTEQELAHTILCLGPRFSDYSIKELAQAAHCSIATIHRLCRKLGLEGMKELKIEMARSLERAQAAGTADINFPFGEGWTAGEVAASIRSVFEQTLAQTQSMLDMDTVEHAASLICTARQVALFTESHNRYPASMFADRLLSVGIDARCEADTERQIRCALLMGKDCVAIGISYSGVSMALERALPVLSERGVPTFLVGTPAAARLNPGLDGYLFVSDAERYQRRITQFASHLAVQYVLDTLFGSVCATSWPRSISYLEKTLPLTRKPGLIDDCSQQAAGR
jgi:DNA-binding MurR/RpiR family transcriptional regulator